MLAYCTAKSAKFIEREEKTKSSLVLQFSDEGVLLGRSEPHFIKEFDGKSTHTSYEIPRFNAFLWLRRFKPSPTCLEHALNTRLYHQAAVVVDILHSVETVFT